VEIAGSLDQFLLGLFLLVFAYGVYRRADYADAFALVATTPMKSFEDAVDPGADYHYRVTAIDRFGAESPYSEEAIARAPAR